MLIKYIKSVLWRVAKRLSYIEEARCLKVKNEAVLRGVKEDWNILHKTERSKANCIGHILLRK